MSKTKWRAIIGGSLMWGVLGLLTGCVTDDVDAPLSYKKGLRDGRMLVQRRQFMTEKEMILYARTHGQPSPDGQEYYIEGLKDAGVEK
jgi:hypothetical protein